mgnify:CR=1 FL=1
MTLITDIHTHRPAPAPGRIVNIDPSEPFGPLLPCQTYSVGIHPWHADLADMFGEVERLAACPAVVAIGETGLDKRRGPSPDIQIPLFRRHIELAEAVGKPLIVHCVGAWQELLALPRPRVMTIIHGFRGKPELARQLTAAGFFLSLGARYNPASEQFALFRESDMSDASDLSDLSDESDFS